MSEQALMVATITIDENNSVRVRWDVRDLSRDDALQIGINSLMLGIINEALMSRLGYLPSMNHSESIMIALRRLFDEKAAELCQTPQASSI